MGREAFEARDFERAAIHFQEAFNLDPHPVLMFNIARANEELRALPAALAFYRRVLQMDPNPRVEAAVLEKIAELEGELIDQGYDPATVTMREFVPRGSLSIVTVPDGARLFINDTFAGLTPYEAPRVDEGTYEIRITHDDFHPVRDEVEVIGGRASLVRHELQPRTSLDEYRPPEPGRLTVVGPDRGLPVYVDGRRVGFTPLDDFGLAPGRYTVSIHAEGWNSWEEEIVVRSGATHTLGANLDPTGRRHQRDSWSRSRIGTTLLIGGGAVAATGATFGILALSDSNRYNSRPNRPERADLPDRASRRALTGDILMGVGAATIATGVVLHLLPEREGDEVTRELVLGPELLHGGGGLLLQGRFR